MTRLIKMSSFADVIYSSHHHLRLELALFISDRGLNGSRWSEYRNCSNFITLLKIKSSVVVMESIINTTVMADFVDKTLNSLQRGRQTFPTARLNGMNSDQAKYCKRIMSYLCIVN